MDINRYLNDAQLMKLLDKYNGQDRSGELKKICSNLKSGKMIVPVLGMQGMGKSTLINAILGKNILPNDADETTCVPVEVCFGEQEYAEVFFRERKDTKTVRTREELNSYVDNNENPANEKNVERIVLYARLPLLKSGMVIVDLPGVGSLTAENGETTGRYIRDLCTAVFVIPTNPTIRKQEVFFIKSVWSQFPTAIFVQNHWGEPRRELEESVEYNNLILKKVAKELNNSYQENITVVNAYNALMGRLNNDSRAVESSGLPALLDQLKVMADRWTATMEQNMLKRLYLEFVNVRENIVKHRRELDMTVSQIEEERRGELEQFNQQTKKLRSKSREISDYLDDAEENVKLMADNSAKKCAASIRKDIFMLIDSGITDGSQLTDAFRDFQEEYVPEAMDSMFYEFQKIKLELDERLSELEEIELENTMKHSSVVFENGDAFKFEKSFAPAGSIIGGLGGLKLGALASGAIATALGVESISLTNPITLLPGLAAMAVTIAIGFIGGLLGNSAKKGVSKSRASQTKSEIAPYIDKIEADVSGAITGNFAGIRESVLAALKQLDEARNEQSRALEEAVCTAADSTAFDRQELDADMEYITSITEEAEADAKNG